MLFRNVELHNVHELLSGTGPDMLPPAADEWLAKNNAAQHAVWRAQTSEGLWFSRIPDTLRRTLNALAQFTSLQTTGAEVRAVLDPGATLNVSLTSPFGPAIAEVYQGDAFVSWHVVGKDPTTIPLCRPDDVSRLERARDTLGGIFDPAVTRLLLPAQPLVRLLGIQGESARPPAPDAVRAPRWLSYGSSITHGSQSVHPSGTYAARAAHRLGVDLLNLGLSGGAHLEPGMADYIASRADWDFATFEMGINILSLDPSEFARRVARFIETVASARPDKHIFCIDLFTNHDDVSGGATKTAAFRRIVKQCVAVSGRSHVRHLNGRRLLMAPGGLTTDLVHPSPQGMEDMGERLARALARHIPR
jgi:hypothetical protein